MAMINTAIRLSQEELDQVDGMVTILAETPDFRGLKLSRSEVLRMALARGMDQLVEQYGEPRKARTRKTKRRGSKR